MTTSAEHVDLYGRIRKVLLSRFFALGQRERNDFFQDSSELFDESATIEAIDKVPRAGRVEARWQKRAGRDNPWLFGSKLTVAIAEEANQGLPGAQALLGRTIRSYERLFPFSGAFAGLPLRWDPTTSDSWWPVPDGGGEEIAGNFLIRDDGKGYVFSPPGADPRHFPLLADETGRRLMGNVLFDRHQARRGVHRLRYRFCEASQDEMMGVLVAYAAACEAGDARTRLVAKRRLGAVAEYFARHGYMMVMPHGGLAARGAGDALPALEHPIRAAIHALTGDDLTRTPTVTYEEALERAGVWELFRGPTDRAMALAWAGGSASSDIFRKLTEIMGSFGTGGYRPKFLNPGQIGFVAGIYLARDGFDVSNEEATVGLAIAALLHSWTPVERLRVFIELSAEWLPANGANSTGFVPYIGLLASFGSDPITASAYDYWLGTRRRRGVHHPRDGYDYECFSSAVSVLLGAGQNVAEEAKLVDVLSERHDQLAASADLFDLEIPYKAARERTRPGLDYVLGLALAWRYRRLRQDAGQPVTTAGFPDLPGAGHRWPAPAVPRAVVEHAITDDGHPFVPAVAMQGIVPPVYNGNNEAELFVATTPERGPVRKPTVRFPKPVDLYDEQLTVDPGRDLNTGMVLQWGDEWDITATGSLVVGGSTFGPNGDRTTVWDARFPVHGGRDRQGTEHCLVARLNNYFFVGARQRWRRWQYHEEALLYLRLNQVTPAGTGGYHVRIKVRGAQRNLTKHREVTCITPDSKDPRRGIDGLGGVERDGKSWHLDVAEAIDKINAGTIFVVRRPGEPAVELRIGERRHVKYLATVPDRSRRNNLSMRTMPHCPG